MKVVLLIAILFYASLAFAEPSADVYLCGVNNNDCAGCLTKVECGFCGAFGQGYCVPGNAGGSLLLENGVEEPECPTEYWKYGAESCVDTQRAVNVTKTSTSAKFESFELRNAGSNVYWNYIVLEVSCKDLEKNEDRAAVVVGYAYGKLTEEFKFDKDAKFFFFATGFWGVAEFFDLQGDGLTIDDVVPDNIILYALNDFTDLTLLTSMSGNTTVYNASVTSADGKFHMECRTANGDFLYEGLQLNPYEMKCDILLGEYNSLPGTGKKLAIVGAIISAELTVQLHDDETNNNGDIEGNVLFGSGVGFFKWSKKVVDENGKDYAVQYSEFNVNSSVPYDASAKVILSVFTFNATDRKSVV